MKYFEPIKDVKLAKMPESQCRKASADPRIPMSEGSVLEGYRIGKVVGRGSFSLVYSAREVETGDKVVIKEFYPKHFANRDSENNISPSSERREFAYREGLRLFFSEALTLKKIKHPNVLNTQNFFNANQTAYLVSSNQDGRDLRWFLCSFRQSLDQSLISKVFMPILSALNYLHGANMLHLDIKPANILLQPDGHSLLLDFGAAQAMNSSKRINRKQILTHGFAPPEQYDKNRALGPWTDIYAVAATLHYCVVGRPPAKSKDNKIESKLDIARYCNRYHPALLKAINRGLNYDEKARFDNIDDFAAALLQGTDISSLIEYEASRMGYDRFTAHTRESQIELARYAA